MSEIRFYRAAGEHGYLSNLWLCPVLFDERVFEEDDYDVGGPDHRVFRSSEDAYQYGKPRRRAVAEWLIAAPKPHLCAAAAHALLAFDVQVNWQAVKVPRMRDVLRAKFTQHATLAAKLLATDDRPLIEESKTDPFWGVGRKGDGKNMLGVLLMDIRAELRGA